MKSLILLCLLADTELYYKEISSSETPEVSPFKSTRSRVIGAQRQGRELHELGNHCPLDQTLNGVGSGFMARMREDQ